MPREIDQGLDHRSTGSALSGSHPCTDGAQPNGDGGIFELVLNEQDLLDIERFRRLRPDLHTTTPNTPPTQVLPHRSKAEESQGCTPFYTRAARPPLTRIGTALVITLALMVSGRIVYRGMERGAQPRLNAPALAQARPQGPEPRYQPSPPVRFKNPFDPAEVFEFPPGTSKAKARQAVANLLIERARERKTQRRRTDNRVARR